MKIRSIPLFFVFSVWFICLTPLYSLILPELIYVVNYTDSTVYSVDPLTGGSILVTPTPVGISPQFAGLDGFKVANASLGYTVGFNDGFAYSVDLKTGGFSRVSNGPIGIVQGATNITLLNDTIAYVVNQNDDTIYSLNLTTGSNVPVSTIPGNIFIDGIALKDTTGYVVGYSSPNIYAVDLLHGTSSLITTTIPGTTHLGGIALVDNTAYVVAYDTNLTNNRLYSVDLSSGITALITTIPGSEKIQFSDIAIVDGIAYTAGASNNKVYAINLQTGITTTVTPTAVPGTLLPASGLFGLGVLLFPPPPPPSPPSPPPPMPPAPPPPIVHTQGLGSSILTFANYLNANAPLSTLSLFDSLSGAELIRALEAAIPTRNGFATFAAQNGYLASAQVVTDHLHQKRFAARRHSKSQVAMGNLTEDAFLVDASGGVKSANGSDTLRSCALQQGFFTGWLGGFGEYAREKAQQQTPAFNAKVGGAVVGMDYNCINDNVIGFGGSYAYTHVHEDRGMGNANVHQGFLGLYSALHAEKWYFDLGVWGGYYHTNNHRKISFTGFNQTAKSTTHGWQVAPHFEVGYDGYFSHVCHVQWFGVSPFLLADWVANWEHGFSEHGASGLNMSQKRKFCSLIRGETGLRFHEIVTCGWGNLVFQEKGSYAYQKMFRTGNVTAFLVGAPGSFTVSTLTSAQNLGVVEFSMLFKPSNRKSPYVDLRYQGEFGSKYQSHQGILEVGKDF